MNYYYPQTQYSEQPQATSYYQIAPDDYELRVWQQPRDALLAQEGKEKARKMIDPPPFVEVMVREAADPIRQFLQSPYLFMNCLLVPADTQFPDASLAENDALTGGTVSTLNKLKDVDNREGGFFIFGDISVKRVGEHKLMFNLYDMPKGANEAVYIKSILSDVFTVHPQKEYPGLEESTPLSKTFSDQGVRIRLRKESRNLGASANRKRGYPYSTQSQAQAGSSRTATAETTRAQNFPSSPPFATLARSPSKRARGDDGGYTNYARPLAGEGSSSTYGGMPEPYDSPNSSTRMQPPASQVGTDGRNRWIYNQISTSGSGPTADFPYRGAALPRLDPSLTGQPSAGMLPAGTVQSGGSGPSTISPASGQLPYGSYGSMPGASGYPSYPGGQPYRTDTGYASQSGMYSGESGMPSQYGDPSQGYSGSFDNNGRSGYNVPTTRGWPS